jgi:type IV pilus assembly protein PilW
MAIQNNHPRPNRFSQRGFSLVELMVGMTIGLFLMGAVGMIYVNTATSSRASTLESQMNEDAALALELLQQQIRLAGFSNVNASGARLFPGRPILGCDGGFTANGAGTAFQALACNAAVAGPDALAVRYEASVLNSHPVTTAGGLPGNCAHEGLNNWNALAAGEGAAVNNIALADNRYYIANDADGTPSLFCQGRVGGAGAGPTGSGFGNATALIPNIEDMQLQFAVTFLPTVGNPIPHQVAGYVDASHAVLGATAANWSRVAAIRLCLLARSSRPVPVGDNSVTDLGTYRDCNGAPQTVTDRFVRRAYVTTIQLRNMRPALPAEFDGSNPWSFLYEN